jgi:hypothetical protein
MKFPPKVADKRRKSKLRNETSKPRRDRRRSWTVRPRVEREVVARPPPAVLKCSDVRFAGAGSLAS